MSQSTHTVTPAAGRRLDPRRLGALAGMVAPAIFFAGVVLATWLGWDYLHNHGWELTDHGNVPWPSGTALAEHGWVQSANFAVTGLLLLGFVTAWRRELPRTTAARAAGALLTVLAVALALSAFNTDPNFGEAPQTWHGTVHLLAFIAFAIASVTGMLATFVALRHDPEWRGVGRLALVATVVGPASIPFGGPGFYVYLLVLFGWFAFAGARLWRLRR